MINVQRLTPFKLRERVPDIQELQVDPGADTPDTQSLLAAFENEDNAQRFVVQGILDQRLGEQDAPEYLVKWRGYPVEQSTWEPESHLDSCARILEKWKRDHGPPQHQEIQTHASDLDTYTPATEKLNSEPVVEVDRNPVTEIEPQVPSLPPVVVTPVPVE